MSYTTFEFYKDIYFGNSITEENFPRVSERASEYIDYLTFNRINEEILQEYNIKIQKLCCAIADFLNDIDIYNASMSNNSDNRPISSKTVGSISVTYANKVSYVESYVTDTSKINAHIYDLVSRYLADTGLLNGNIKKVRFKR